MRALLAREGVRESGVRGRDLVNNKQTGRGRCRRESEKKERERRRARLCFATSLLEISLLHSLLLCSEATSQGDFLSCFRLGKANFGFRYAKREGEKERERERKKTQDLNDSEEAIEGCTAEGCGAMNRSMGCDEGWTSGMKDVQEKHEGTRI